MQLYVKRGNIVQERVDAVVCPTNSEGRMAAGIGAAMKNAGSATIENEAKAKAPIPVGSAIVTNGHNLASPNVIHAATTAKVVEQPTLENIRRAVVAALETAETHKFRSVAFPYMGNRLGTIPLRDVAQMMVQEIRSFSAKQIAEILLIAHEQDIEAVFKEAMKA